MTIQRKQIIVIEEPEEIDPFNPASWYDSKYVPPNADKISKLQSMKYDLSKQQLKLEKHFAKKLTEAILENKELPINKRQDLYVCRKCDYLLFRD